MLAVGERPFYHNGTLYYIDMFDNSLYRFAIAEDRVYKTTIDEVDFANPYKDTPGFIMPIQDKPNQYLVGLGRTVAVINWDGQSYRGRKAQELFTVPQNVNLNGLLVSPQNDWYIGSFAPGFCAAPASQSLIGYLRDQQIVNFGGNFKTSVGEALVGHTVYQIDACTKTLSAFDWNPANGQLGRLENISESWIFCFYYGVIFMWCFSKTTCRYEIGAAVGCSTNRIDC